MRILPLLFLALGLVRLSAQPVNQTTSFTRDLLRSADAATALGKLIPAGLLASTAIMNAQGALTHAGTVTLNFDPSQVCTRSISVTGSLTLAFSNLATNRNYRLLIQNAQSSNITLSLPAGVHGYFTTTLSNGWHMLAAEAWGSVASNVWISTSSDGAY